MTDDIFCKIIRGEIPADKIMEEKEWLAFKDIHPAAAVHILIVPKKHISDLSETNEADAALLGKLLMASEKVAKKLGLEKGYRVIINKGEHGGQLVPHLHFHLLGGQKLGKKIVNDD